MKHCRQIFTVHTITQLICYFCFRKWRRARRGGRRRSSRAGWLPWLRGLWRRAPQPGGVRRLTEVTPTSARSLPCVAAPREQSASAPCHVAPSLTLSSRLSWSTLSLLTTLAQWFWIRRIYSAVECLCARVQWFSVQCRWEVRLVCDPTRLRRGRGRLSTPDHAFWNEIR